MKVNQDYVLQEIVDEYIVVPVGKEADRLHGVIKLNASGSFLWKMLVLKDQSFDNLLSALMKEYAIDRSIAEADVNNFLSQLRSIGCLEE